MNTLDAMLDTISVISPDMRDADEIKRNGNPEWFAVCDNDGIVAYFAHETDAFAFRLMLINMQLNYRKIS